MRAQSGCPAPFAPFTRNLPGTRARVESYLQRVQRVQLSRGLTPAASSPHSRTWRDRGSLLLVQRPGARPLPDDVGPCAEVSP
jgi:hypothetical protein